MVAAAARRADDRHAVASCAPSQVAQRLGGGFVMKFAMYSLEKQNEQRRAAAGTAGRVDVVSYVEFQKNYA